MLTMDKAEEIEGRHLSKGIPLNEEFILPLHADAQLLIDDINLQRRPASGRCQFDYLDQFAVVIVRFKRIRQQCAELFILFLIRTAQHIDVCRFPGDILARCCDNVVPGTRRHILLMDARHMIFKPF